MLCVIIYDTEHFYEMLHQANFQNCPIADICLQVL